MSNKYGSTWWGQQWLNAFSNIDVSNRLPHGRSYANTGKVHSVEVNENKITAKVQGSRPNPYRVEIIVPLFSKPEKQDLISEVARNPALVARLLNRELPPDVMEYAENHGVNLFPKTWKDFEMKCSCPDWTVPCNHLSAVIYTVAEEIDKNPFLVFEVHGLDLVKELEGRNVRIVEKKSERVTSATSLLLHSKGTIADILPPAPKPARVQLFKTANNETPQPEALDFTALPDLDANLLVLFRPSLVFFDKDFKEAIQKIYADAGNAARKLLDGDVAPRKMAYTIEPEDRLQLVFDENLLLKNLLVWDKKGTPKPLKEFRPEHLVQILHGWDLETLRCTHPATSALLDAFNFSLTLAKNRAIMPQLLEGAPGTFRIRWLPAVMAEEVRAVFEKIAACLPPDLLSVQTGKEERNQSQGEMLNTICSVFIGTCVSDNTVEDPHPLVQMFRSTTENKPESFDSEDTAQMLQVWLNNFYLAHKDYVPLLKVVDEGDHFSVELLVEDCRDPQRPPVPLSQVLKQKQYEPVKLDVLKDVMRTVEFFPQLHRIVESQGDRRLSFSTVRFVDVLLKNLPVLRLFGTAISLPVGMEQFVRPQAAVLVKKAHGKKENPSSGFAEQLAFGWQVALGDDLIPIDEFEKLVINLVGIVKMRDRYVLVDEDELVELFQKFDTPPHLSGVEALQAMLTGEYQDVKIGLTAEAEALTRQFVQPAETPLPQGLNARLRPYQRSGYEWLLNNARLGFGSLLADDMGLGKTLQVIAALLRFKEEGLLKKDKALVIVPAPLLANWRREMEKFAPTLTAAVYYGQRRKLDVSDPDIIITTYGVASSEVDLLKKMSWYCTVIDEAQHIKNAASELTKSVKSIPASVRIALISIPLENRLSECWSIMDFTNKGWLGSQKQFTDTSARPIQRDHDRRQAAVFKKITAPLILRRLKSDRSVIADLPDKIENNQYATLTPEQAAIYEDLARMGMEQICETNEAARRQELVLKMMSELRQVCNHPHLFLKSGDKLPERSGKAALLFSLLDNIYENGEKTLILTQSQETGELLSEMISERFAKAPLFLHDDTGRLQRDNMVAAFETGPGFDTLILCLKTGSASLNLTAAAHAIHVNGWWRPAPGAQTADRPNRIVPPQNRMAWRLLTQGTFEEKIDEMIRAKKDGANLNATTVENWIAKLSNEDLKVLVAMG